jgi:hypothetical protein
MSNRLDKQDAAQAKDHTSMRRIVSILTACLALVAVAGCSTGSSGAARTGNSRSAAATSRLAPPITEDELDIDVFANSPCKLMRPDQLAQHGLIPPGNVIAGATGRGCRWEATTQGTPVEVDIDGSSGGLEGAYQRRGTFGFFEPTEIANYPSVHTAADPQAPRQGHCTVRVGVSKTTLLTAVVEVRDPAAPDYTDACSAADKMATIMIGALKRIA